MRRLLNTAFFWMVLGLLSGVFWREYTKAIGLPTDAHTALSTLHTHLLALGMLMFFVVLALDAVFRLSGRQSFTWFYWLYNGGLAVTIVMMVVRGLYEANGVPEAQTNGAIPGIAGLGHIALTGGLICLYVALHAGVKEKLAEREPAGGSGAATE